MQKLNAAEVNYNHKLTKTGRDFAHYSYFELSDFLPRPPCLRCPRFVQSSFGTELAELSADIETGSELVIPNPMSRRHEGCHPVQNLGAVQTYLRYRPRWVDQTRWTRRRQGGSGIGTHRLYHQRQRSRRREQPWTTRRSGMLSIRRAKDGQERQAVHEMGV